MKLSTAIALVMVLAISAIFLVRQSTAYRDASRPIQDLAATADLIVLADVEQVTSAGDRETAGGAAMPPGTDQVARLRVRETWKGPPTAVVEVAFNDFVKWPAPPAYASGETVVAFLRRAGPEWTTVGISAGIVDAGRGSLADLRQAVEKVARRAEDPALDAIAAEFVEHPPADATLPETLKRLAGRPDADVDRAAITALESVLDRPQAPRGRVTRWRSS